VTLQVVERDPDDDRVLECAVTGKADVIVTGDLDLLSLREYEGISIIQVAEFLDLIGASDREP
jgi:predicted nucleic acid-binding protein